MRGERKAPMMIQTIRMTIARGMMVRLVGSIEFVDARILDLVGPKMFDRSSQIDRLTLPGGDDDGIDE